MEISGQTVLITGGASGIGLALAEGFLERSNHVIVIGQNEQKLEQMKLKHPTVTTYTCNLRIEAQIDKLVEAIMIHHPTLNVLINNAGIQHNYSFLDHIDPKCIEDEIYINLTAPIILTSKLMPLLSRQSQAAIINVSSGLGLVPKKSAPVYCGTKAGLHIFTKSLRDQLATTQIRVFEIIPPVVDTNMTRGRGRDKISPKQLADQFFPYFRRNQLEVPIGKVKLLKIINRIFPSLAEAILRNA
ncbi:SDR family NAD(P)-dependent oxidoreductase [Paenibacillus sp. GSMTC-2017]|uniref:SDR family oxidoreductase n=1 Tax=Paenibacillus sp. GSMTC-2017 TaxID=2794350 RepID=UPI0018D77366|nr:SDR family NAD(P)-dependent oxidoreductase [Paenibacillus sp. GSMTC-2017]MBH5319628.1 SDR family NAD(P)-dependent oxidoreductase [Paenibacillus sp. GSMTC-2017]